MWQGRHVLQKCIGTGTQVTKRASSTRILSKVYISRPHEKLPAVVARHPVVSTRSGVSDCSQPHCKLWTSKPNLKWSNAPTIPWSSYRPHLRSDFASNSCTLKEVTGSGSTNHTRTMIDSMLEVTMPVLNSLAVMRLSVHMCLSHPWNQVTRHHTTVRHSKPSPLLPPHT